jgi:hypothetical protein
MPRPQRDEELAEVTGTMIYQTVDAWRVEVVRLGEKGPTDVWLPKSKCERVDDTTWLVPEWLADRERLI